jgi:hypothetical protein
VRGVLQTRILAGVRPPIGCRTSSTADRVSAPLLPLREKLCCKATTHEGSRELPSLRPKRSNPGANARRLQHLPLDCFLASFRNSAIADFAWRSSQWPSPYPTHADAQATLSREGRGRANEQDSRTFPDGRHLLPVLTGRRWRKAGGRAALIFQEKRCPSRQPVAFHAGRGYANHCIASALMRRAPSPLALSGKG